MRPVPAEFEVNQPFGSYATGGVNPNQYGTEVQQLVYQYGNYQPYGHAGCDIACPIGTPVQAIAAGTVLWADWGTNLPGDESDAGYRQRWYLYKTFPGIVTVIQHDGWISVYAHLSDAPLNPGDVVTEGQIIALSGNTRSPGVSLGAHLHVEALIDMTYATGGGLIYGRTDPTPYFGGIAAQGTIQEDDMPLTDDDLNKIALKVWGFNNPALDSRDMRQIVADIPKDTVTQSVPHKDPNTGKDDGQPTSLATMAGFADFQHNRTRSDLPAAVLNQAFTLPDGTRTNLAGILAAINAKPATGGVTNVTADPQTIAASVVNAIVNTVGIRTTITKN